MNNKTEKDYLDDSDCDWFYKNFLFSSLAGIHYIRDIYIERVNNSEETQKSHH